MFYQLYGKRFADIVISLVVLPLVIGISIPVSIFIKLEDGGSILYKGARYGKNMNVFQELKFRSMKMNAKDIRNEDGTTFNSADDPRVTKVGRILRKTSVDELPQIWNVLVGDMSLVGPRPSPMGNESTYSDFVKKKFGVRPGITGLNQALYRNNADLELKYKNDVYYAEHVSLMLDLKILLMTIRTVLSGNGLYKNN